MLFVVYYFSHIIRFIAFLTLQRYCAFSYLQLFTTHFLLSMLRHAPDFATYHLNTSDFCRKPPFFRNIICYCMAKNSKNYSYQFYRWLYKVSGCTFVGRNR